MSKTRGFEVVTKFQDQNINLPKRQTKNAAGYDIECAKDTVVPSIWKNGVFNVIKLLLNKKEIQEDNLAKSIKPVLVPTGLKSYMQEDEVLILACRSSNPLKRGLSLPNGIGVIDSDYYNNESNEGEIFVQLINFFPKDVTIKKGERIAQGIFIKYLKTDNDLNDGDDRTGGFGSSGLN
ncbi:MULTISPECIES: dUTP diphosphatase [Lactobacillaceae]|uniref:dUTP diphosphatase n=1 Tax=Lactobacillaceae TaxID=33958 RepID=UPI001F513870|nr:MULTISPECIES: dUTP diphosphatase [Lactobacillaceae]